MMIEIGKEYVETPAEQAATAQIQKVRSEVVKLHPVVIWRCSCGRQEQTPNGLTRNKCVCGRYMEWSYD